MCSALYCITNSKITSQIITKTMQKIGPSQSDAKKTLQYKINVDYSKDRNLSDSGRAMLLDRYLVDGEVYQDLFSRVAKSYADNNKHAQRIYNYMSSFWFMPATPILSNGGVKRGLPISCFLNEVDDSLQDIVENWNENVWLASKGGGIGTYWGNVRSIGEKVKDSGKTSGIIPFLSVQDRLTLAISQGSLRRGSAAMYLPVSHPEIEEFIEIRRQTGGDPNRRALNLHHGIVITNYFMNAVEHNLLWELTSPKDKSVISVVKARDIWIRILLARIETGEPYLLFIDNVNNYTPSIYKRHGVVVKTSNLCSEITLATGKDHKGKNRTAVCCLSSVNLEKYDEWCNNDIFITDIMIFLDNVLQDFIDNAPNTMKKAKYAASRERSVGLGVMGFHSFLQSKMIPMESVMAKSWNLKMFKHINNEVKKASKLIAKSKGACPDAQDLNIVERFTNKTAVAPTASISVIAGSTSPGIEPFNSNAYTQKSLTGSFNIKNRYLKKLLKDKGRDSDETWLSIINDEGSVRNLKFLSDIEKDVFKTAFEINQQWLIDHAADRTPYIDQAQSLNIFVPANVDKKYLNKLHYLAWKKGIKSLYYCRSKSLQRAEKISMYQRDTLDNDKVTNNTDKTLQDKDKYDECLSCQ